MDYKKRFDFDTGRPSIGTTVLAVLLGAACIVLAINHLDQVLL